MQLTFRRFVLHSRTIVVRTTVETGHNVTIAEKREGSLRTNGADLCSLFALPCNGITPVGTTEFEAVT
jgi:hypothetical protein